MSLYRFADEFQFSPPEFRAFLGRDYVIEVEGERVGWILCFDNRPRGDRWMWVLTGFGYGPERISICGQCRCLEAAKTEFISAFNNWLNEPGAVRH
jgi:hypothetical protein